MNLIIRGFGDLGQIDLENQLRCDGIPSGKRLQKTIENQHFEWVNQRTK